MSNVLNGLPTQGKSQGFIQKWMERTLDIETLGMDQAFEITREQLLQLFANGELAIQSNGVESVIVNPNSRLTSDYRVCLKPALLRHTDQKFGRVLPSTLVEELQTMANAAWSISPFMYDLYKKCEKNPVLERVIAKVPALMPTAAFVLNECGNKFHLPLHADGVTRTYAEGTLSYTGAKPVRYLIEVADKVKYTPRDVLDIAPLMGVNPVAGNFILKNWDAVLEHEKDPFATISTALWIREVLEKGESGRMGSCDIRLSGGVLAAAVSGCRSLMADLNIYGGDNRDARLVTMSRVKVPEALEPYRDFATSKDMVAKPLITQLLYGQAARGGAETLMWRDEESAPMGWISGFGVINTDIVNNHLKVKPKLFNPDSIHITAALGPAAAWRAYLSLSESYNRSFWASYPEVLVLRQRLEEACKEYTRRTNLAPRIMTPHGWEYRHVKWVMKNGGKKFRFRVPSGVGNDLPNGVEISLQEFINSAEPFSFFVRLIHLIDAWMRWRVSMKIIKWQRKVLGRYVGHGTVHDNWIVPMIQIPAMHPIVRSVLHELVEVWPPIINKFLVENGQEPIHNLSDKDWAFCHRSIKKNRAFLSIG